MEKLERWEESGWIVKMEGRKKQRFFPRSLAVILSKYYYLKLMCLFVNCINLSR